MRACAKCRRVFYCGRECQKEHWKRHKKRCGYPMRAIAEDGLGEDYIHVEVRSMSGTTWALSGCKATCTLRWLHKKIAYDLEARWFDLGLVAGTVLLSRDSKETLSEVGIIDGTAITCVLLDDPDRMPPLECSSDSDGELCVESSSDSDGE